MKQHQDYVNVIGAGLAGCEASLYLASHGVFVRLFEMKPDRKTPAHKMDSFAELVCSNSLKSTVKHTASGLLKTELEMLGSTVLQCAKDCSVPSDTALSVDRNKFSAEITAKIESNPNIKVIHERITELDLSEPTIVATGPLTDSELFSHLQKLIGKNNCYFYDAVAPIISTESVDMKKAFWANRYGEPNEVGDYLNCFLSKEEYEIFYNELINAETVKLKEFEDLKVFEGCMPVEIMAKRGLDALRYGPMKPVGLSKNIYNVKPHAVVQLRKEDEEADMVNMVGFQTNLTFPEQKRVFSLIPALKQAEFFRYGVMHRNSYINAPTCLNEFSQIKDYPNIFVAGQLSGVEGYVESFASGLFCAINMVRFLNNKRLLPLPKTTMLGGLINYIITSSPINFQPMGANFGILPPLGEDLRDKALKKEKLVQRAVLDMNKFKESINGTI